MAWYWWIIAAPVLLFVVVYLGAFLLSLVELVADTINRR